jgi:hypothetical protein
MDDNTFKNWVKIKEQMESSGKTNNTFYKRACAIISTGKDPMENFWNSKK